MSADKSKDRIHISEIGILSDEDLANLDARNPHGPLLEYLGTVTRSGVHMPPDISLESVKSALDLLDTIYPRKNIASYMKMSRPTHDEFLKRVNPWRIGSAESSSEQMTALEFNGVQLRIDNTVPDGIIGIYNSDDGLIKECRLYA